MPGSLKEIVLILILFSPLATAVAQENDTVESRKVRNIGILIFENVDLLDVAGPHEVFSLVRTVPGVESRFSRDTAPFQVFTIAESIEAVRSEGGLSINPDFSFSNTPPIDLLIVPGGPGARALLQKEKSSILNWVKQKSSTGIELASVCTGSLLLARAGILSGREATTHWGALDLLSSLDETIRVKKGVRYVDDDIVTSAGVSSGIYMSLYIVEKLLGKEIARDTARLMDYDYPAVQ